MLPSKISPKLPAPDQLRMRKTVDGSLIFTASVVHFLRLLLCFQATLSSTVVLSRAIQGQWVFGLLTRGLIVR